MGRYYRNRGTSVFLSGVMSLPIRAKDLWPRLTPWLRCSSFGTTPPIQSTGTTRNFETSLHPLPTAYIQPRNIEEMCLGFSSGQIILVSQELAPLKAQEDSKPVASASYSQFYPLEILRVSCPEVAR